MRILVLLMGKKKKKEERSLAEGRLHCQSWHYCEISSAGSDRQLKMMKSPFITSEGLYKRHCASCAGLLPSHRKGRFPLK